MTPHTSSISEPKKHPAPTDWMGTLYRETLSNGIELFVAPRTTIPWDDFIKTAPRYSIALDGVVPGRPRYDLAGPFANFNHHEDVDRLCTRATCAQVEMEIRLGLLDTFRDRNGPRMNIFVNDPDQDASLSVWLLKNHHRVTGRGEAIINRLVNAEDRIDATAGAYPFSPDSDIAKELNWIFEPYNQSRKSGELFRLSGAGIATLISAVGERITQHSLGRGGSLPLDIDFERMGGGRGWALIKDSGPSSRTGLFAAGIRAFVAVTELGNGRYKYSIGKVSPFTPFPVQEIYDLLNTAEGIDAKSADKWGGGDIIGGSPRLAGSKLKHTEVEQLINRYLNSVYH